jgi:hypothetical protein
MNTRLANLDDWSTDQLFGEVLDRSAGDRTALDHIQAMIIRALLDDCDRKAHAAWSPPLPHWMSERGF